MCQSAAPLWAALCCSGSLPGAPLLLPLPRVGTQAFRSAGPRPKRKREVRVRSAPTRQRAGTPSPPGERQKIGPLSVLERFAPAVVAVIQNAYSSRPIHIKRLPYGSFGRLSAYMAVRRHQEVFLCQIHDVFLSHPLHHRHCPTVSELPAIHTRTETNPGHHHWKSHRPGLLPHPDIRQPPHRCALAVSLDIHLICPSVAPVSRFISASMASWSSR